MRFAIDTGALLSLACSQYFEQLLQEHTLIVSPRVIEELKQFSKYDDFLGRKAQSIVLKKFAIKTPRTLVNLAIEETERAIFSIAVQEKCIPITDDIHAARIASEKLSIISKPSFYLLLLLYKRQQPPAKAEWREVITPSLLHSKWFLTCSENARPHLRTKVSSVSQEHFPTHKKIKKVELIEDLTKILIHRNWISGALGDYAITLLEQL